eukprot:gene1782-16269_t
MASRKRKFGTIEEPSQDELNDARSSQNSDKSLRLQFDDYTSSDCDSTGQELSIKVFNDPVHGHIEMHPLCTKIVDTPQFQRLRDIKQLGGCYLVFPGASHNRFEHSLGVSYLAGKLCQTLCKKQPSLCITPEDILCVKIAGLCHDLGHGPFSHLFDGIFIPMAQPTSNWKHENASTEMLDHLIKENDLWPSFQEFGLEEKDLIFIKEMIAGFTGSQEKKWTAKGRGKDKSYLYQIVANKKTGIDVDKWDYFARDCHHLGISNNFDYKRFVKFARVVEVDDELQICTRDKEVGTLYDMFHTRNSLHRRAYQHKTGKILDFMFSEVLLKADPYFLVEGKDGKKLKISESIHDMVAYSKISDSIFSMIENSSDPQLQEARDLLRRIRKRDLFKLIGQTILKVKILKCREEETRKEIVASSKFLNPDDFIVHIINFDYGMKDKNPMDFLRFYHKSDPNVAVKVRKDQVSQMLPEQFAENHLRLYCRSRDQQVLEEGQRCFEKWCLNTALPTPKVCPLYPELTPSKQKAEEKKINPFFKERLQF